MGYCHDPGNHEGRRSCGSDKGFPLAGQGIAGLVATIREGNAYANVHTIQFPPGEIRGQA